MLNGKLEEFLDSATEEQLEETRWLVDHPEYEERPVDIRTFINHPSYLGLQFTVIGNRAHGCRPKILEKLEEIFDPEKGYEEFVLCCGIGWGKDFACSIVLSYQVYRLACLREPQLFYGLSRGSSIHLMLMSINETHARDVLFGEVKARIDNSDWFRTRFQYNKKVASELQFPKNIYLIPGNSKDTSFVGYNIFTGIIDEGDDYTVTETRNDAIEGWNAIKDRIVSRFQNRGMLGSIGSPKTVGGFMISMYENAEGVKNRYRMLAPTWDSLIGTPALSGKTFKFRGMTIPVEYEQRFVADPERALRDLGARPALAKQPYITFPDKIKKMFSVDVPMLFETKGDAVKSFSSFKENLKGDPNQEYYCHIDLAVNRKSGDRLGLAVGHVSGMKDFGDEEKPLITIDLAMVVTSPPGGEIMFRDIKQLIFYLQEQGFTIVKLTSDSWNSVDILQTFRSNGIDAEILSVDKLSANNVSEAYEKFKDALYEERILCHPYPILKKEMEELELLNGEKVDHRPNGCFTGDTRVALLNGTNPTFKELFEIYKKGESFEVYSMSKDGVCVGKARNPRITKVATELIELTLDNYQVVRCTPDHLFMTIDGDWARAENLTSEVSIMPLYRVSTHRGGWIDYETVWCPVRKKSFLTHHISASGVYGDRKAGQVIHHIDGDRRNNSTENLLQESLAEHARRHTLERHRTDREYVKKLRDGHRIYRESGGNEKSRQNMLSLIERGLIKKGKADCLIEGCNNIHSAKGLCNLHYRRMMRFQAKSSRHSRSSNHRIISLKRVVSNEDVWDITVDGYHNFALSSGIFVHNSKDCVDSVCGVVYNIYRSNSSRILSFTPSFGGKREFE